MFGKKVKKWLLLALAVTEIFTYGAGAGLEVYAETDAESVEIDFTEEEQALIQEGKVFKVGYVQDRIPVSFQDENGDLGGISRDIFDRIQELSGLKFEYVMIPEGSITYDYLQSEGFDLVTSVEYNKENKKANGILMSDPYLSSRKVIVAREDEVFDYNAHLTVAVSTGSQTLKKVLNEEYPFFEIIDYPSIIDCLKAVNTGKVDLMIQNQYVVEYWLYKPAFENLKVIPAIGFDDQLCFSAIGPLDKEVSEWKEQQTVIGILNKTISAISEYEISGYIVQETLGNQYEYHFSDFVYRYRYTIVVLGLAFLLILILIGVIIRFRMKAVAEQMDAKAKRRFFSAMSHEICTPLNGMIGLNSLMHKNLDNRDKLESYLQQSSSTAKYLLSLVYDILDMSKLQEKELEIEYTPVNLMVLIPSIELVVKDNMDDKQLHLTVDAQMPYPGIIGDEARIRQILVNILDNACKFTSPGGKVTVTVRQSLEAEETVVTRVDIADTGCGMSEEFQKKIFEPFTQERKTVSRGNEGTGLGMAISYHLAKRMGGDLSVSSKKGEGSCFTFVFPAQKAALSEEDVSQGNAAIQKPGILASERVNRVLVAEDNELNAEILIELLESEGIHADLAENGRKAADMFAASEPGTYDVILMDLLMPEMNGFEAAKAIRAMKRKDAKTVRIFACTANSFREDYARAMECGMDDFIAKPIDMKVVMEKIQNK